jgi:hypothetical protein
MLERPADDTTVTTLDQHLTDGFKGCQVVTHARRLVTWHDTRVSLSLMRP